MTKNITEKASKQRKLSRRQQIDAAQKQWHVEDEQLAQEKDATIFKEFSWDAFLQIPLSDKIDTETQSKVVELQNRYRELKELKDELWAEDRVIDEFNKTHAVVSIDQTYILTEKINSFGEQDFSLESRQSFRIYYEDEMMVCFDGVERCKADIWLKSSRRRKYKGIVFEPSVKGHIQDYYNLWQGFTLTPLQGNCSRYWAHVKDNICNGDEEANLYLRKWLACIFQHPDYIHTALVLCGSQGVGKNSFVEPLGFLLGPHYAPLSNISQLVSNFNSHLKNAVLIHANEALWGGNKKDIGTVKAMITDSLCLIESKGKDQIRVRNFKHVILSSNEDWPVHLDADDRRFFVLRVSEKHKEDTEYFKAIQEELKNGGYEALLYDLLHEDMGDFNPRRLPSNADSFAIKMRSANSAYRYLYEMLSNGCFFNSGYDFEGSVPKDFVYGDYATWCTTNGEDTLSKENFGRAVKKLIISVEDTRPGSTFPRQRCYKFPTLQQALEDFSKAFKEKPERIFDNYEELLVSEITQVQTMVHNNRY